MRTWSEGTRDKLGKYEPLALLAKGGMASVHVARQRGAAGFERLVVIKRIHRQFLKERESFDMFVDEARVASLIRHPNVVPVIDVVEEDGELFLILEYFESISLSALLEIARTSSRVPPAIVSRIAVDMLSGLHAAHEAVDMQGQKLEVVHRDVSPQNLIVGIDGTSRLIDFGIAKATRRLSVTSAGVMKGKFGYMSPEQAKQQSLDRRSDVFSAGIVLYEGLTGVRLFDADDEGAIVLATLLAEIPDPSTLVPGLSAKLDFVVQTALARDREERFQSAAAFQTALEASLPPASHREVAAWLERHAEVELTRRRTLVRGALEARQKGEPAPTLLDRDMPPPAVSPPKQDGAAGALAATWADPHPARTGARGEPREAGLPTTTVGMEASHPTSSKRAITVFVWIAIGIALAIVLGAAYRWRQGRLEPAPEPAVVLPEPSIPLSSSAHAPVAPATDSPAPAAASESPAVVPPASTASAPSRPVRGRAPASDLRANPYR